MDLQGLNLNDMLLFAKVAETGGISAAAREMGLPKSTVSRRLVGLEQHLGVALIERSTRALKLTEAGRLYYQHCKRVEEEAESSLESINTLQQAPRGLLRVSCSVATGQYLVAPHLAEFKERYPEIQLELKIDNRHVDLISEGFDLAIRVGKLQDSSLISKSIGSARAALFVSPEYLANAPVLKTLADLKNHKCIVMSDAGRLNRWELWKGSRKEELTVDPEATINDFSVIKEYAAGGGGVCLLPEYIASDLVSRGQLINILPEWRSPVFKYYAIYASRRGETLKMRAWLEFFSEKFPSAT